MKFYKCFFTDLPDQFVEANSRPLSQWTDRWHDNPYLVRSRIVDGVQIDLIGDEKRTGWPTLKSASQRMLDLWMTNKGGNYSGRYWETLATDQRRTDRVASLARRKDPLADALDAAIYAGLTQPFSSGPPSGVLTALDLAKSASALLASNNPLRRSLLLESDERPPLKRDGVVAGEIVGYRCWRVQDGVLRSVYQRDVWRPGRVLQGRELGDWDSRGIHAWKGAGSKRYDEYVRSYLHNRNPVFFKSRLLLSFDDEDLDMRPAIATGTVFLWGDVVEHEHGWRAEFARVRSLDWLYPDARMMGREQATLDELRRIYGVSA